MSARPFPCKPYHAGDDVVTVAMFLREGMTLPGNNTFVTYKTLSLMLKKMQKIYYSYY